MLAELYVGHVVSTAAAFLEAPADDPEAARRVAATARMQLRLVSLGQPALEGRLTARRRYAAALLRR